MRGSSEVSADRIADLGALAGEHQARAMQLQHALLLRRLHPDEAHRRTGGLTFIPVDGAEQCANLGGLDDRGVVLHLRRNEGAMQVDTNIPLRTSGGDSISNEDRKSTRLNSSH